MTANVETLWRDKTRTPGLPHSEERDEQCAAGGGEEDPSQLFFFLFPPLSFFQCGLNWLYFERTTFLSSTPTPPAYS